MSSPWGPPTMSRFMSLPLFVIFALGYACIAPQDWGDLMDLNRTTLNEYELIQSGLSELNYAAPCTSPIVITTHDNSNKTKSSFWIKAEVKSYFP